MELRYFGGLSVNETAEVLKISPQSVLCDWKLAKACLPADTAQECFLIFSSTIHTGSPSAPRLASSASCTVEQHFSGTTERIGS